MADWNVVLNQINQAKSVGAGAFDLVRRDYLKQLHVQTNRNVIIYYSGWLHKTPTRDLDFEIVDGDKTGFMTTTAGLDLKLGLDLILHTPGGGGEVAATESIVHYLHGLFGHDIRVIVPQIAMSAGTMIACAAKRILMGTQSNLGPIDPLVGGLAASGVIEEFTRAHREIKHDLSKASVWQPIIANYTPTLVGECEKAMQMTGKVVKAWLREGMFNGMPNCAWRARRTVKALTDHPKTMSHARHIHAEECKRVGLVVEDAELDPKLHDLIMSVHNAAVNTMAATVVYKIIENHLGIAYMRLANASPSRQ